MNKSVKKFLQTPWHDRTRGQWILLGGMAFVSLGCLYVALISPNPSNLNNIFISFGSGLLIAFSGYYYFGPTLERIADRYRILSYPTLDYDMLLGNFKRAEKIDILNTWLQMLVDNPDGTDGNEGNFFSALTAALLEHATIRILILDPNSTGATERQRQLTVLEDGKPHRSHEVRTLIMTNLRVLHEKMTTVSKYPKSPYRNLEIRVYDDRPRIMYSRWDNRGLFSYYEAGKLASSCEQLEFPMTTRLGLFLNVYFDELWTDAYSISLEQYMRPLELNFRSNEPSESEPNFPAEYVIPEDEKGDTPKVGPYYIALPGNHSAFPVGRRIGKVRIKEKDFRFEIRDLGSEEVKMAEKLLQCKYGDEIIKSKSIWRLELFDE